MRARCINAGAIREVTPSHADVLTDIHRSAFSPAQAWSRAVFTLQLELPRVFGFLHDDGAMILARVAADEAEILTLAVAPEQRRHGLGSTLLLAAMRQAARMGATTMFLEVSVTNEAARKLYATQGFTEAGRRRGYYADGTDALVLRRDLSRDG